MLKSDVKKTMTPSPIALIISMIIPESPAALPDFILLIALDTISGVILIAGPMGLLHSYSQHSMEIRHAKAIDNEITRLSADHRQPKLAFDHHF